MITPEIPIEAEPTTNDKGDLPGVVQDRTCLFCDTEMVFRPVKAALLAFCPKCHWFQRID